MLGRAIKAGVPAAWVTADEAYGQDYKFRSSLEQRRIGYVVAVPRSQTVPGSPAPPRRLPGRASACQAWQRRSCGAGAEGPRILDSAIAALPCYEDATPPSSSRSLLVRRAADPNARGARTRLLLPPPLRTTTNEELIRVAGSRWPSRNASRPPRTRPAWTTTRSAATTPGTATSRWPCWPTPTWRSRRRPPQKPWQRPHPPHARRGPPSPGTPDRCHPQPRRHHSLVTLATPPPAPRPDLPLPAEIPKTMQHNDLRLEY